jgi:hypothetical protein
MVLSPTVQTQRQPVESTETAATTTVVNRKAQHPFVLYLLVCGGLPATEGAVAQRPAS